MLGPHNGGVVGCVVLTVEVLWGAWTSQWRCCGVLGPHSGGAVGCLDLKITCTVRGSIGQTTVMVCSCPCLAVSRCHFSRARS